MVAAAIEANWPARDNGTIVVINGPRFSTRAESRWHAASGGDVVGMTGMPEAAIARELALCCTSLKSLLLGVVAALPTDDECSCRHALDGINLPFELP